MDTPSKKSCIVKRGLGSDGHSFLSQIFTLQNLCRTFEVEFSHLQNLEELFYLNFYFTKPL
jgi:hypothetical protein